MMRQTSRHELTVCGTTECKVQVCIGDVFWRGRAGVMLKSVKASMTSLSQTEKVNAKKHGGRDEGRREGGAEGGGSEEG